MKRKIIYGTNKRLKREEFSKVISDKGLDFDLYFLNDINFPGKIDVAAPTFKENSIIKTKIVRDYCDSSKLDAISDYTLIMADDAGLVVDALGGKPGINPTGVGDSTEQIGYITRMLSLLRNIEPGNRGATLVCVLTAIRANGEIITVTETLRGRIATQCGDLGSRVYSPIFIPDGEIKVLTELKDYIMPHAKAFAKLLDLEMKHEDNEVSKKEKGYSLTKQC